MTDNREIKIEKIKLYLRYHGHRFYTIDSKDHDNKIMCHLAKGLFLYKQVSIDGPGLILFIRFSVSHISLTGVLRYKPLMVHSLDRSQQYGQIGCQMGGRICMLAPLLYAPTKSSKSSDWSRVDVDEIGGLKIVQNALFCKLYLKMAQSKQTITDRK